MMELMVPPEVTEIVTERHTLTRMRGGGWRVADHGRLVLSIDGEWVNKSDLGKTYTVFNTAGEAFAALRKALNP